MDGILNRITKTVHRHETGATELHTDCGVTYHLDPGQLETVSIEEVTADDGASKCGRCFDDGGGY